MRKPQRRQILKKVSGLDRIWIVGKESLLQSVSFGLVWITCKIYTYVPVETSEFLGCLNTFRICPYIYIYICKFWIFNVLYILYIYTHTHTLLVNFAYFRFYIYNFLSLRLGQNIHNWALLLNTSKGMHSLFWFVHSQLEGILKVVHYHFLVMQWGNKKY